MADSEFERFKKMFPGGKKDMNVLAIPSPLPGPGGIGRAIVGRAVQSGVRRFGDAAKESKGPTKMKDAKGLERRDPMEPRVVPSGRSKDLQKVREGGGGPTKMKDRRGLEIRPPEARTPVRASERPPSRNMGSVKGAVGVDGSKPKRSAAGTYTKPYDKPLRGAAGTYTKPYDKKAAEPKKAEPKKAEARKPAAKKVVKAKVQRPKAKPGFKGNWTGAAPTQMQKRGGARVKSKGFLY